MGEVLRDGAEEFADGVVVGAVVGGRVVYVDDVQIPVWVPDVGVVFDRVVAHGDDQI